jgi:hypothetical protein
MIKHQITHIRKPDVNSSVDRITHVKYDNEIHTVESVIMKIDNYTDTFYTLVSGEHADVNVVRPSNGRAYIRTSPDYDGEKRDNLLSLPQC